MTTPCRRTVLVAGAATCGTGLLGACSGAARQDAAVPALSPDTASTPERPLVALADVEVGEVVSATAPDGGPLLVGRTSDTEVVAFSAVCTHQGCTVKPSGDCPCHGSKYAPLTGEVINGPAPSPLLKVAVQVVDGQIVAV